MSSSLCTTARLSVRKTISSSVKSYLGWSCFPSPEWSLCTSFVVKCCIRSTISGRIGLPRFGRRMQGKLLKCFFCLHSVR